MNFNIDRASARYRPTRARGWLNQGLKPLALRSIDIVVSALAICFLAPVFAILAAMPVRNDNLGLSQLPQLFLVFAGEMSLFDRQARQ
jgi:lipopolysaccharide/colanic/teichoic acid biosynthesis glycosyltransferase